MDPRDTPAQQRPIEVIMMTPTQSQNDHASEAVALWLTYDEILARFGWIDADFKTAVMLGFPGASGRRQVRRVGLNGLPETVGIENVWSRSAIENWARAFRDLATKTRLDELRG
jgi:hypothetical protein